MFSKTLWIPFLLFQIGFGMGEIEEFIEKLHLGKEGSYKKLTLYPLIYRGSQPSLDFILLDEAINKDYLVAKEVASGEVNSVLVKNKGEKIVFGLSGEIILGGKQDRMLKEDILIPSKSDWIKVGVYCTEAGRWRVTTEKFEGKGYAASPNVRRAAKIEASQDAVWKEIEVAQAGMGVSSPTSAFKILYEDKETKAKLDPYLKHFEKFPSQNKDMIGVIVVSDNRILCLDAFGSHRLFSKMWKKLLSSYVVDVERGEGAEVEVKEFWGLLKKAETKHRENPGLGDLYIIQASEGKGSVLTHKKDVVHLDFFPSEKRPPRLDIRRGE